jgi:uncharacterized protein with GYD domain
MPMFVVLGNFTEQGVRNFKQLPQLVQDNMQFGQRLGLRVHGWYLTEGRYDFVILVEAPDDQTMAAQVLTVAGRGNSRTETLHAFSIEEAGEIIRKMG